MFVLSLHTSSQAAKQPSAAQPKTMTNKQLYGKQSSQIDLSGDLRKNPPRPPTPGPPRPQPLPPRPSPPTPPPSPQNLSPQTIGSPLSGPITPSSRPHPNPPPSPGPGRPGPRGPRPDVPTPPPSPYRSISTWDLLTASNLLDHVLGQLLLKASSGLDADIRHAHQRRSATQGPGTNARQGEVSA
ncbi:hypothetical protein F4861DRAFT_538430 [Xylaria intraflava]|nr:hypothetical protein F4861DRAFT_538430 [Xylaria intraflava]